MSRRLNVVSSWFPPNLALSALPLLCRAVRLARQKRCLTLSFTRDVTPHRPPRIMQRRTARQAVLAEVALGYFRKLPPFLTAAILARLPAADKARAACACRTFREALADGALWSHLQLVAPAPPAALAICLTRLRGAPLLSLDLTGCSVPQRSLMEALRAHAPTLRVLRLTGAGPLVQGIFQWSQIALMDELLRGHALQELHLGVSCGCAEARIALSRTGELRIAPALRVHILTVCLPDGDEALALLRDAAACPTLQELTIGGEENLFDEAAIEALADATCALQLRKVQLVHIGMYEPDAVLSPALTPALARMLGNGSLQALELSLPFLRLPLPRELCAAFGACATLETVTLDGVGLWEAPASDGAALLRCLEGHPALRELSLAWNIPANATDAATAGRALRRLLAADAPALKHLSVHQCFLGEPGLVPLCAGLGRNRHLEMLSLMENGLTRHVARDALLPAVRACTSLRELQTGEVLSAAQQVELEVAGRSRPAAGRRAAPRGGVRGRT